MKIAVYVVEALIAFLVPSLLLSRTIKKSGVSGRNAWYGVCVYVLFAVVLYGVANSALSYIAPLASAREQSMWVDALVSGALFSLCSALGRLIWVRFVVKDTVREAGLVYGIGFAMLRVFITYGMFAVGAVAVLALSARDAQVSAVFEETLAVAGNITLASGFVDVLFMASYFVLETAVSVVFFQWIKNGKNALFALVAVLGQFAAVSVSVLNGYAQLLRLAVVAVLALALSGLASWLYGKKELSVSAEEKGNFHEN